MKISIFYFSGTGNTWFITEKIKYIFQNKNIETITYSIERKDLEWDEVLPKILIESNIIGIGFPVHASDIPLILKAWIKEKLVIASKKIDSIKQVFIFDTMAMFSGDTPLKMRKLLKKGNFKVKQAINIRMLCNIPQMRRLMVWDKDKQAEIFKKAEKKCEKFTSYILKNKKWVMRRDPISRLIGAIQRIGFRFELNRFMRLFKVDYDKCNSCGICIDSCPKDNLSIEETDDGQHVVFGPNCTFCMRCFNICPQNAIIVMERSRDVEKYRRFRGQIPDFNYSKLTVKNNHIE